MWQPGSRVVSRAAARRYASKATDGIPSAVTVERTGARAAGGNVGRPGAVVAGGGLRSC